jgi:hypothetical protein
MSRHRTVAPLLLAAFTTFGLVAPAAAITEDEFRLRSGADLVALCSTPTSDPLYVAAVHMCHGFGAGTYQTLQALTRNDKLQPLVCPPDPPPSRNAVVGRFVEWAKANPQYLTDPPADLVGRFLITEYPCKPK